MGSWKLEIGNWKCPIESIRLGDPFVYPPGNALQRLFFVEIF
jgi:hypothetical protein